MKRRKILCGLFALTGVSGCLMLLQPLWLKLVSALAGNTLDRHGVSIGVIGGADGPTAIFVTTPGWTAYLLPVLLTVLGLGGLLYFRKNRKK